MQVETTQLGPCHHKLQISVDAARVRQEMDHVYQAAARNVRIPGFRPGKIPASVLQKHLGDSLIEEARQHVFEHVLADVVRQEKLNVLRLLDFDPEKYVLLDGQGLDFEVEVETAPEIELPSWDQVRVDGEDITPTAEQKEDAMASLAREHARFDPVPDQVVDAEHLAVCDLAYHREEEAGPTAEGVRLGLGAPLYGADAEEFDEVMNGAKASDQLTLKVEFKEGFSQEDWIGSEGQVHIEVREIVKPRPGTPAEIAEDLQLDNEEALSERIDEALARDNELTERDRLAYEVLESLNQLAPFDLPPRLTDEEVEASIKSQAERLEKQGGLPADQAAAKAEEGREVITQDSRKRLCHYFLIRKVAEKENIKVSRNDMEQAFRALAQQNQVDAKSVKAFYEERGMTGQLRNDILDRKVRARLVEIARENAEPTEAAPSAAATE